MKECGPVCVSEGVQLDGFSFYEYVSWVNSGFVQEGLIYQMLLFSGV